jgi:hypothetical protein
MIALTPPTMATLYTLGFGVAIGVYTVFSRVSSLTTRPFKLSPLLIFMWCSAMLLIITPGDPVIGGVSLVQATLLFTVGVGAGFFPTSRLATSRTA